MTTMISNTGYPPARPLRLPAVRPQAIYSMTAGYLQYHRWLSTVLPPSISSKLKGYLQYDLRLPVVLLPATYSTTAVYLQFNGLPPEQSLAISGTTAGYFNTTAAYP
jgi:hypothetical protein